MHFGENQLSRSLIGLSPLPTGHPPGFQPWWVRSSTRSYPRFNLPMGRSLRFGSMTRDSDALFRLAFATAPPHGLTLPHIITRRLILQKARGHFTSARRLITLPRLVGTRFQVLFHDPSPGHFSPFPHGTCPLSVTREYLGLGGGPPGFTRDFSGPVLLGIPSGSRLSFAYGGVTLCADAFQASSATQTIFYFLPDQQLWLAGPTTPVTQRLPAMTRDRFGLFPFRSPLLRESLLLSLPVGTEMFHFPTLPPPALCVQAGAMGHYAHSGFPIRRSPDRSLVADSPGLIAGSYVLLRLLVPRHPPCALINLATTDDARVHCAVLKIRSVPVLYHRSGGRGSVRSRCSAMRPFPQDPTACSAWPTPGIWRSMPRSEDTTAVLASPGSCPDRITSAPLVSCHPEAFARDMALDAAGRMPTGARCSLERR